MRSALVNPIANCDSNASCAASFGLQPPFREPGTSVHCLLHLRKHYSRSFSGWTMMTQQEAGPAPKPSLHSPISLSLLSAMGVG